jgi:uncharacterized protein involved in outer membrane biogenesis
VVVDINRYRGIVQAQLEKQLGRKVTLGNMSLGLTPLRLRIQGPTIAEDPAFGTERPFVSADALDVRISLSALLNRKVDVQSVELERPRLELIQNSKASGIFRLWAPSRPSLRRRRRQKRKTSREAESRSEDWQFGMARWR